MSLNLNTPQVRNYTGLNAVPSGSTIEPDTSVKYTPQTLTEEQQAQARQNIGAAAEGGSGTQVQANWNETDTESPAYIQNKPTIPAAQVQSDWNQSDDTAVDYIKNKPSLPVDEIPGDFRNSITVWSNVDTRLTSMGDLISVYNRGVKTTLAAGTKTCDIKPGKNVVVGALAGMQFANKGGIYWVWTPRSFPSGTNTIFTGSHKHLNVIYYGGGFWNSSFGSTDADANSKIFVLNNASAGLWQGFNNNDGVDIVFPDDTINLGGLGTDGAPSGRGKWYVPQVRYKEFIAKCATKWSSADPSTYLSKIVVYNHLEQRGFELNIVPSAQADWNETDTESPAYIQNKPTIPAAQVQSDWNQSDTTALDYIKNKPAQTLELTMTDEDGNVITGTFILSSKTVVPAV